MMAGNQRGQRGQNRGRGGLPGAGFAQSGGKATSFAGGGGTGAGGYHNTSATQGRVKKVVSDGRGGTKKVRDPGGDATTRKVSGKVKRGTGLERAGAVGMPKIKYHPGTRGRGGSNG